MRRPVAVDCSSTGGILGPRRNWPQSEVEKQPPESDEDPGGHALAGFLPSNAGAQVITIFLALPPPTRSGFFHFELLCNR